MLRLGRAGGRYRRPPVGRWARFRVIYSRHTVRLVGFESVWVDAAESIDHVDLQALYRYWDAKRAGRRLPSRRDMDVLEMQPWLGHLVLLDIIDGGRDFLVRIHGTVAASRAGEDLTKRPLSSSSHPVARNAMLEYRQVAEEGRPLLSKSRIVRDGQPESVRKLTLPLSDSGDRPDRIIAGIYGGTQLALTEPPPA